MTSSDQTESERSGDLYWATPTVFGLNDEAWSTASPQKRFSVFWPGTRKTFFRDTRSRIPNYQDRSEKSGKENEPQKPFDFRGSSLLCTNKKEQIIGTQDKPQCLVVQRLLSHLQYLVCTKSSTKDLSPATVNLGVVSRRRVLSSMNQLMKSGQAYFFSCNVAVWWTALLSQHGFRLRGVQS